MGQERLNRIFSGLILVLLFYISGISGDFHQHKNYSANTNSIKLAPAGSYPYLKRIGNWPYGAAIAVAGDTLRHLVYLGSGGAVLILDVSDLSRPKLVSDVINTTGLVVGLKYNPSTRDLYVATHYEGFQIWDVDDPAFPVLLAKYKNPDPYYFGPPVNNVDYSGDYAILERSYVGVSSIDISDPENPVYVSGDITMGNPARDIYVSSDGRLHATGAQNYVKIYIQPNGYLSAGYTWNTLDGPDFVAANSDAAFLSVGNYLVIINTQSVSYPIWSYVTVGRMYDIVERGDFLYFTVDKKLQIYDVSNYQNPVAAGSYTAPSYPNKLDVLGSIAYIADDWSGLRSVNVEDPNQPVELGYFETFSSTINTVRSGDYAYMAEADDGMLVMDLKDLANPSLIGQYNTPGNANAVRVEGNIAYIADGDGGLRIADITNPTQPTEISAFDSLNWAREVCISGNYAYVVDDILNLPDWIRAIDISDPANPIEVGSILMPDNVDALDAAGNYLYAAATDAGMRVINISDPSNLNEVGFVLAKNVFDVCVRGQYAYLASADWEGGMITLDISDPTAPVLISVYNPNGWLHPFNVTVEGEYAYLGDPVPGYLHLIYIGNPAFPSELGVFRLSGDLLDIYAQDSLVYVSDGKAGLHIFENDLFFTSGAGITWTQQFSGTTEELWSVDFANASTGWSAGYGGVIVKTDDGGQTWLQQSSGTSNDLFSIFVLDKTTGWAAGREGTILKTSDGGDTWQQQNTATTDVFRSICFTDANNGWACGQHGTILHTTDGGQTWLPQSSGTNVYLMHIYFADNNHGWIACSEHGQILRTDDGGASWQTVHFASQANVYSLYFINQSTGWAVTADVEIFKTTDGGITWTLQYHNPLVQYDVLTSIYFTDENNGWAVGYRGRIISTADGGETWIEQTSGVQNYLTSVYFADPFTGWVVGKEGTILKASSAVIGIDDDGKGTDTPKAFDLLNNYPNPFNSTTTISYSLPENSRVTLKIYNVLGREVKTLLNETQSAGIKSVMWDGRDDYGKQVSSGIYLYRIQSGSFTATKKMVLLE